MKFDQEVDLIPVPSKLSLTRNNKPHPFCVLAAEELQNHILTQKEWQHNFGLDEEGEGMVIGKMFGVLVVQNQQNEIGYLAAFSGKLAGSNQHDKFVPPVFDLLTENGFLNVGMQELTAMNKEIDRLIEEKDNTNQQKITALKEKRKSHSIALQNKIFDQYHFLNLVVESRNLIFHKGLFEQV